MIELRGGEARAIIDETRGGRIASLDVADLGLLLPEADDPMRWGCYPMAPWAGRVRRGRFQFGGREYVLPCNLPPHAIHGTTFFREWTDEGEGQISSSLGDDWPWPGHAVQHFSLSASGLDLRLEVHADESPFPASAGWHPWFRRRLERGHPARLDVVADAMYRRDADGIPTGELVAPTPGPWDDCFTKLRGAPRIVWPGALDLSIDTDLDHLVVYDEPAHALCVEPQTAAPNALNAVAHLVEPGKPLIARARIAWTLQ